jgi:hypothetical protein
VFHQFIRLPALKLFRFPSDHPRVSAHHHLPAEPVRSKGHATLQPVGHPEQSTTIRDISASGIGVIAAVAVDPGTLVHLIIHDHAAHGIVHQCRPEGSAFYIGITLAA